MGKKRLAMGLFIHLERALVTRAVYEYIVMRTSGIDSSSGTDIASANP